MTLPAKGNRVVVLGGGLAGAAAAFTLARAGNRDVTVIESGPTLGGLAGSFERDGHFYPLGYHHILHRDRTLLFFLDLIGALPNVRWRRIRMLFHVGGREYDLGSPDGFLGFPMGLTDKARFVRLMLTAFRRSDWSSWEGRTAAELVDRYGGPGVRKAIFEPLTRLKFELPCDEVSGAWLGARLHYREGSAPLGYIPDANWTKVLCDGVTSLLAEHGVRVLLRSRVARLHTHGNRLVEAELESGQRIGGDQFVSAIPTETYLRLCPEDDTNGLAQIRYSGLISVVCATRQAPPADAYWINLVSPERTAGGIFLLTALNPTIGRPGDTCVNFVTHLHDRHRPLFALPEDELLARYRKDFREVFGYEIEPYWTHVARVPMYSPVFRREFRNPPIRSDAMPNVWFAGNYRTFPSVASTGTALGSGIETGTAMLTERGIPTDLAESVGRFRLRGMRRG